jgi:hypothetical protein
VCKDRLASGEIIGQAVSPSLLGRSEELTI